MANRNGQNVDVERGGLRLYIGAAAGVGATYAMLDEALRRSSRGTKVVVGRVDTKNRPHTEELLRRLTSAGAASCAVNSTDIINARPGVVLVDDLGVIDSDGRARWQLVDEIRDAGIDVVATTTIQHVASLRGVIEEITGAAPEGEVPDSFLRTARQIEIVDSTPEAIRRRIAHGNVFRESDVPPEVTELFDSDAFARLRLLLFEWFTDFLARGTLTEHVLHERVVVVLSGDESDEQLLQRAMLSTMGSRSTLVAVDVRRPGTTDSDRSASLRSLVEARGGIFVEIEGSDDVTALTSFAESERATRVVVADDGRRRGLAGRLVRASTSFDVHVVGTTTPVRRSRWQKLGHEVSRGRMTFGLSFGLSALVALTVILANNRSALSVATSLVLYLLIVVLSAAVGGFIPGITLALVSPLVVNWYLIPPYHTLRINNGENILELAVFVTVASIVASFVSVAARRTSEAQQAWREASTLFALVESGNFDPVDRILDLLRTSFGVAGAAIVRGEVGEQSIVASSGDVTSTTVTDASFVVEVDDESKLAVFGKTLGAEEHRILHVFVSQLGRALEQRRLHEVAIEAETLSRADELKTAILRAVSHDLRSPLASIKASVSSLRQDDVEWSTEMTQDFLESIESESDRLTSIVTNLLDLSRLEAGVMQPALRPVALEEVIPAIVTANRTQRGRLRVDMHGEVEEVLSDPSLVDRILANLVDNALKWSDESDVAVRVHQSGNYVQVHVVDHGPGIPQALKQRVREPFHRVDDKVQSGGLGLGLAIADRLAESIGGRLELRDTPGGGLTAVVFLPIARRSMP